MTLKFTNSTTKEVFTFDVEDIEDSRLFFHFSVTPEDMPEGSYVYELFDDEDTLKAKGIAQVGDYKNNDDDETTYSNDDTIRYYEG